MPEFWMVGFASVLVILLLSVSIVSVWRKKRHSARRTAAATVVAKRSHTTRQAYCKTCAVQPSEVSTSYYVTFQFDSGDRLELLVPAQEVGYLIEGDRGQLTFQGTRFLNFERR